jgi:DNA primase
VSIDTDQLKSQTDIVEVIGRYVQLTRSGSQFEACCPFHDEKTPSFKVHPNGQYYKCHGCGKGGDVIEFLKEYHSWDFKKAVEYLGAEPTETKPKNHGKKSTPKKSEPAKVVPLELSAARDHYTEDALRATSGNLTEGKSFVAAWKYFNEKSEVEIVVVRWEDEKQKKTVLTYYWNGKSLKMKNYPVLLYNRHKLATEPEKDVLIVFGEKCAEIADSLEGFIGVCWNGGEKKVHDVDLTPLKNRTVFIWPDDDQPGWSRNCPMLRW